MARPRTPTNILKLKGADKKNPARMKDRENEPVDPNPIGDPPEHLNKHEKAAWHEIISTTMPGVLVRSDRIALEMAACLLTKLRGQKRIRNSRGKMVIDRPGPADKTQFFRYLSHFGMMPADRARISIPKEPEKNPFDDD